MKNSVGLIAAIFATVSTLALNGASYAADKSAVSKDSVNASDRDIFQDRFQTWTDAFNRKDYPGTCDLFSQRLKSNHQGIPAEDYQAISENFKKVFANKSRVFKYKFKLHETYRSNDLGVAKITWYLETTEKGKPTTTSEAISMDIFEREKDGKWRIVNFVSYGDKMS